MRTSEPSCFDRGLPLLPGPDHRVTREREARQRRCHVCQAVAEAIVERGLAAFDKHREAQSRKPHDQVFEALRCTDRHGQAWLPRRCVQQDDENTSSASLILAGIPGAACIGLNDRDLDTGWRAAGRDGW